MDKECEFPDSSMLFITFLKTDMQCLAQNLRPLTTFHKFYVTNYQLESVAHS